MALSQQKTTVAALRGVLGVHGQEKRFAELAGRSVSWVKKVSAGLEPLTEEVARVLSLNTGVSVGWLLDGDPATPPKVDSPAGIHSPDAAYTISVFEAHRALLEVEARAAAGQGREHSIKQLVAYRDYQEALEEGDVELLELCKTLLERTRHGQDGAVIRWRLKQFLNDLGVRHPGLPRRPHRRRSKTVLARRPD